MSDEIKQILREKGYDIEGKTDADMMLDRAFWEAIVPNPNDKMGKEGIQRRWEWWAMAHLQGALSAGTANVVWFINHRVKNKML